MAPNRFRKDQRERREVTPFSDDKVVSQIPAEWRDLEAPMNFTWVVQDELAGMGWPKSRDQVKNFNLKLVRGAHSTDGGVCASRLAARVRITILPKLFKVDFEGMSVS